MLITNSGGNTEYQITLKDVNGNIVDFLSDWISLTYSRSVNNVGTFQLVMPAYSDPILNRKKFANFGIDRRIEIQRSIQGGQLKLDGETFYLIRKMTRKLAEDGTYVYVFSGVDTMDLLRRRVVTPDPKAAAANISAVAADNALKTIFTNNFLTGAGRDLSAYMQVQPNFTAAPVQTKQFQGRNVLTVMQEICASAAQDASTPTYLAFDLVWNGTMLEFRTYTGQRGSDRRQSSGNPLLLGPDFGNMSSIEATIDCTQEATFVYAGLYGSASSATRIGASPFGRIEKYYAAQGNSTTEQNNEAAGQVRLSRPHYIVTGSLVQTDGFRYGLHYGYGDYLTAQFDGVSDDMRLDGIQIDVREGLETVGCVLRNES